MTSQDGSKAHASAIWIGPGHLLGIAGWVAEKTACGCSFRQQNLARHQGLGPTNEVRPKCGLKACVGVAMREIVTAGILVIGDEILSGRTKDKNIGFIAEYLTNIGIDLKEVRVVADEEPEIVAALNALRHRYTYVFTTGGIGPTHDDITADAVGVAFGVPVVEDPRAIALLLQRIKPEDLNEARRRMAHIPQGADLVENSISKAPGFKIGNVIVMAGVPA